MKFIMVWYFLFKFTNFCVVSSLVAAALITLNLTLIIQSLFNPNKAGAIRFFIRRLYEKINKKWMKIDEN